MKGARECRLSVRQVSELVRRQIPASWRGHHRRHRGALYTPPKIVVQLAPVVTDPYLDHRLFRTGSSVEPIDEEMIAGDGAPEAR
jgi:hypothetical protein